MCCLQRVLRYDPVTGKVQNLIGTGVFGTTVGYIIGSSERPFATLQTPYGVAVTPHPGCKLYISDATAHVVRVLDPTLVAPDHENVTIYAGMSGQSGFSGDGDSASSAKLDTPRGLWYDSGLYVADSGNNVSTVGVACACVAAVDNTLMMSVGWFHCTHVFNTRCQGCWFCANVLSTPETPVGQASAVISITGSCAVRECT